MLKHRRLHFKKQGHPWLHLFVTGAAALLMEWGIVRGNDLYMYGDKLKASLIKGAGENVFTTASRAVSENTSKNTKYPNPVTGWGTLCLLDSIP